MVGKLNEAEIDALLLAEAVGRVGCHTNGKTLVVPVTYAFDGDRIICHAAVGEKVLAMRENPNVCFEVDRVADLRHWRSVIVQGVYRELAGDDASVAMAFFVAALQGRIPSDTAHLGQGGISLRPQAGTNGETVVFCIEIEGKSGRFEDASAVPSTR